MVVKCLLQIVGFSYYFVALNKWEISLYRDVYDGMKLVFLGLCRPLLLSSLLSLISSTFSSLFFAKNALLSTLLVSILQPNV